MSQQRDHIRVEQNEVGFSRDVPLVTTNVGDCVVLVVRDESGLTALAHVDMFTSPDSIKGLLLDHFAPGAELTAQIFGGYGGEDLLTQQAARNNREKILSLVQQDGRFEGRVTDCGTELGATYHDLMFSPGDKSVRYQDVPEGVTPISKLRDRLARIPLQRPRKTEEQQAEWLSDFNKRSMRYAHRGSPQGKYTELSLDAVERAVLQKYYFEPNGNPKTPEALGILAPAFGVPDTMANKVIAEWQALQRIEADLSIPEQIISGVIQKNPHLRVMHGESPGDFALVDPTNPENKILFRQDRFAYSGTWDGNKYIIDVSNFDNSAANTPPFSIANIYSGNPTRRDVTAFIRTSSQGIIDEQRFYVENEEKQLYLPVRLIDRRGVSLRLEGIIKPEVEREEYLLDPRAPVAETKSEPKLFPTASMGKMLTGAMLMKACEQIEIALEQKGFALETQALLQQHKASTLMDVPLTKIVELLHRHQPLGNSALANQTLGLLARIEAPKGAESHHQQITPAMLINHAARIPNSFMWKNPAEQTLMESWRADPHAKADGTIIARDFAPREPFLPQPSYSNGNMVVAGLVIEALSGKPIQENLAQIGAGNAVILTERSVLEDKNYARVAGFDQRADKTGKPNDPGYTAGGYLATPETMARFSQSYLKGEIFTRQPYKEYVQQSYAQAIDVMMPGKYANGITFQELGTNDPLRAQGFTHWAGHAGFTPNIATQSLTAVKIEDRKIIEVGQTHIAMATCDTREHEVYNQARQQTTEEQKKIATKYDLALPKHLEHLQTELAEHRTNAKRTGISQDDSAVSYKAGGHVGGLKENRRGPAAER